MLLIDSVINTKTGQLINSDSLIGADKEQQDVFELRARLEKAIQKDEAFLICPYCLQKVKLRSCGENNKYQMHFAHLIDSDICPVKTRTKFTKSEILAIKYNGCKESILHKKMKSRLMEIMKLDERFTNPYAENVIKDISDRKRWKRPDVQVEFNGQRIVFEIQLSTTFLSVIVSRDIFYEDNNIPLIWIFNEFNLYDSKYTERDIFYNNNCNAVVF